MVSFCSSFSYRFVKEFQQLFPDPLIANWNGVFQWAMQLPEEDEFTRDEKKKIEIDL